MDARDLLGVPFVPHGRSPVPGFDCIGLTLYLRPDLRFLDRDDYDIAGSQNLLAEAILRLAPREGEPHPGDILVFSFRGMGPDHVGVYLGGGRFIHVLYGRKVTSPRLVGVYRKCLIGVYRG